MRSMRVEISGRCGSQRLWLTVSRRRAWLNAVSPMACLPMAAWYVFLGDWLWSGKGITPAQMPRMVDG